MGHDIGYDGPDRRVLKAYPEQLRRAVSNLIDNAACHGGKVEVCLIDTAASLCIEVKDDGPGIPDKDKAAMQQPFVRGDTARGMNGRSGFGLGLSIAKAAVETHGGRLDLLDRVPCGLIARITLPDRPRDRPRHDGEAEHATHSVSL